MTNNKVPRFHVQCVNESSLPDTAMTSHASSAPDYKYTYDNLTDDSNISPNIDDTKVKKHDSLSDGSDVGSEVLWTKASLSNFINPLPIDLDETKKKAIVQKKKRGRGRPLLKDKPLTNNERGQMLRDRRNKKTSDLVVQVGQLKIRMTELKAHRDQLVRTSLQNRTNFEQSYIPVAYQYMQMFHRGCPRTSVRPDALFVQSCQARFLKNLMTPDVIVVDQDIGAIIRGPDAVLEQWRRYSLSHSTLRFTVPQISVIESFPAPAVHLKAQLVVKFSRDTIETFYPHILWDNMAVQSLIGLDSNLNLDLKFYFNEEGKVYRLDASLDFMTGLVETVGIDAALALSSAAIYNQRRQHLLPELTTQSSREEVVVPFEDLASLRIGDGDS